MKWAFKLASKILLSRLPIPYKYWSMIGIFKHGQMDSIDYSLRVFNLHLNRSYPDGLPLNSSILEIGPGDSILSALIASKYNVNETLLIDVGDFANKDVNFYKNVYYILESRGIKLSDISAADKFEDILTICHAKYYTNGIESLKKIPSESIDYIWSHSVLEHIRLNQLPDLIYEMKRIMKPGCFASHNIDYQDHLDCALNNLRFSQKIWESNFMANSGFYTNRLPAKSMHDLFRISGFKIYKEEFGKWPCLPTPRRSIHNEFNHYSDDDLINRTSHVLLGS